MLEIKELYKDFGTFKLENISLSVNSDDYFVLLGESGAGKSLLMELIAGFSIPDKGSICLAGKDITYAKIQERKLGLVMQDYAIFPHQNIFQNIAYSLKASKIKQNVIKEQVNIYAEKMSISHLLKRMSHSLSGGELQRVVLARTLIAEPSIILLDEPLTSLDIRLKKEIKQLLYGIFSQGIPIIHITHDFEEAKSLATKIAVIDKGKIIQTGTPKEIFNNPVNEFMADLAGAKK